MHLGIGRHDEVTGSIPSAGPPVDGALRGGVFPWRAENLFDNSGSPLLALRRQIFRAARENSDIAADGHKGET
jgi:hypothetical protein